MKKIQQILKKDWIVPIVSLALIVISFAIVLPSIRYYLDDWPQLYSYLVRGEEGLKAYHLYDGRPFGYWPHLIFFRLWGADPILWHLANYLLRWLVGLCIWRILILIWPQEKRKISWIVYLFSVFPLFGQQSMALMFIPHWMCYLLFSVSLFLMVYGIKNRKFFWLFTILSIVVDIPNLFTYEYFIGLEFIRPVLIWFILSQQSLIRSRIVKTLGYWAPYLTFACVYIYWRIFVMENLREGTSPVMLTNLLSSPLSTIRQLLTFFFRDTLYMILGVWYPTLDAEIFDFMVPAKILSLLLSIFIIAVLITLIWIEKRNGTPEEDVVPSNFWAGAMVIGFAGIVLGCVPGWIIGRTVSDTSLLWNDRFGLPAMFGACIFLVGFLDWISSKNRFKREVFVIVLIGLAVGRNFTIANDYRWSSTFQTRFFWQLKWRAPTIDTPTSILADHEMFPKVGVYPTSFALNLLYPAQQSMPAMDYWFYTLYKYFPNPKIDLAPDTPVYQSHWYAQYNALSQDSLVIEWLSSRGGCVWVLSQNDQHNPYLSSIVIDTLPVSDLERIHADGERPVWLEDVFGQEKRNNWCYYFETADLNRQLGIWDEIPVLYGEAEQNGFSPSLGVEYMPFIEGFAHVGDTEKALELTSLARGNSTDMNAYLCDNWTRIATDLADDADVQSAFQQVQEKFGCVVPEE